MNINDSEYNIADLLAHPYLIDNHDLQLETALLQTDALDVVDLCQEALTAMGHQEQASENSFNKSCVVWENIFSMWAGLKDFNTLANNSHVIKIPFTEWISHYLYENRLLLARLTEGKEYKYRHIRRYVVLPFVRVRECYDLDASTILPCDTLEGPSFSNMYQLLRAGELIKLLRKQRGWDESLSVKDNFRANENWIYLFALDLPFHSIAYNNYDRKKYWAANPSQASRRSQLAPRDWKKKKINGLMNRKEIQTQNVIGKLEAQVEKQKKEIDRKEKVLQFTLVAHNNLKQSYAQLQYQVYTLRQQLQQQNNNQHQQQRNFAWNQNVVHNNHHMYHQ